MPSYAKAFECFLVCRLTCLICPPYGDSEKNHYPYTLVIMLSCMWQIIYKPGATDSRADWIGFKQPCSTLLRLWSYALKSAGNTLSSRALDVNWSSIVLAVGVSRTSSLSMPCSRWNPLAAWADVSWSLSIRYDNKFDMCSCCSADLSRASTTARLTISW